MATKYEVEQLARSIKQSHEDSALVLRGLLSDCDNLLQVVKVKPSEYDPDKAADREFIAAARRELKTMLAEEETAAKTAYTAAAAQLGYNVL